MSSTSSSPSPNRSASPNTPLTPPPLPAADGYMNALRLDPIIEHVQADHVQRNRAHSVSSVSFKGGAKPPPQAPAVAQPKAKPAPRVRASSPPPSSRFQHHVSFDNFSGGEPTTKNTVSFTLNTKHRGYQFKRRSRTFMVGLDENDYSDIALQWMLEELVDDGDEIICLRVIEKDSKIVNNQNLERRQYQKEAMALMERIQTRNDDNRAIGIVLEFAVGKLHATFQKMIQIYEPAMLIVGTRGRSLGGFQGLMSNRNSFSKWCLQYSPVPVVVVRPTEKRIKKKQKRVADPTRHDYERILRESGIEEHETEAGTKNNVFEQANHPDVEACAVAAAVGLQAGFNLALDTFNIDHDRALPNVDWSKIEIVSDAHGSLSPDYRSPSPGAHMRERKSAPLESPGGSGEESSEKEYDEDEDDDDDDHDDQDDDDDDGDDDEGDDDEGDDDEGDFEVVAGHELLLNGDKVAEIEKKHKLYEMEKAEAAALAVRKSSVESADSGGSPRSANGEDEERSSTERPA